MNPWKHCGSELKNFLIKYYLLKAPGGATHRRIDCIAPQFIGVASVRYHFIAYDTALEYFMLRAKDMVAHQRSDSLEIFGCYLEYIDSYNELFNLIKKAFKVSDV